jgi:acyl-homoserine lactone acylase PvdQ
VIAVAAAGCLLLAVPLGAPATGAAVPFGAPATGAAEATSGADQHGETLNVLPPGSRGTVSVPDLAALGVTNLPDLLADPGDPQGALATATATEPKNFADQLEMYDAINKVVPSKLTDSMLSTYYKDARSGGEPSKIVSTESPKSGVTIRRDTFGVPHITGVKATDVAYGAGYAGIQDRMFLTDILRHTGAAKLAAFVGPSASNILMDQEQLRVAPYTKAEAEAQITSSVGRFGQEGRDLVARLDAFLAGMNDAAKKLCPVAFGLPAPGHNGVGFGPDCPNEYAVLQKAPTPYTRGDVIYIASLVGGIFGKGGGKEYADAVWFQSLVDKFGQARATQIYDELRAKHDPEAFPTVDKHFSFMPGGLRPDKPSVALPVLGAPTAGGTGTDAGGSGLPIPALPLPGTAAATKREAAIGDLSTPLGRFDFRPFRKGMSNALVVDARHTTDGHPIAVFGPQTSYYTPQLLDEVDLQGPGIDARGVSFAGTQFIVELGHGRDYAWSATSAGGDMVDTVMERLCNPGGSTPSVDSMHYVRRGKCVPIDHYVHDESIVIPTLGAPGTPSHLRFNVFRTERGVVTLRTLAHDQKTDKDVPVAVVTQRSTYGHEADSAVGFARINNPDFVKNARDFLRAFAGVDYSFNWFYADDNDIAYFNSGLLPKRPAAVEPDLPRWADSAYDWQGWLSDAAHPQTINQSRGFLASWNNKQAPGWGMADDEWGHSGTHRVNLLADRLQARIDSGQKMDRSDVVGVMMDAATIDLRGEELLPLALDVVGNDPESQQAIALLRDWVNAGAHRVDRARTGGYTQSSANALFDTWWDNNGAGDGGLAKDTLRPALGDLVDDLPYGTDDHPRLGVGSSWLDVAWYGYVSRSLRQALGKPVQDTYAQPYCGTFAVCRAALRASLKTAVSRALTAQGVSSVNQLSYDKAIDQIPSTTAGVVGVRPMDWQNRPTFQQVIHYTSDRATSRPIADPFGRIPTTGLGGRWPWVALLLAFAAAATLAIKRAGAPAGT